MDAFTASNGPGSYSPTLNEYTPLYIKERIQVSIHIGLNDPLIPASGKKVVIHMRGNRSRFLYTSTPCNETEIQDELLWVVDDVQKNYLERK